jgi:hypothetical protein
LLYFFPTSQNYLNFAPAQKNTAPDDGADFDRGRDPQRGGPVQRDQAF